MSGWNKDWERPGHELSPAEQAKMMRWLKNRGADTSSSEWSRRARRAAVFGWLRSGLVLLAIASFVYGCAASGNGDAPGPGGYWAISVAVIAFALAFLPGYIWNCYKGSSNGPY